jgi:hypothetical protein
MIDFIFGYENWRKVYSESPELKKNIWIYFQTSDNQDVYLKVYNDWFKVKSWLSNTNQKITKLGLRYRSHQIEVEVNNCDGIYLVRSIKGEFGGRTKECYTIGKIIDNQVHKTMWLTPELIEESSFIDNIEDCFEEAIIHYEQPSKTSTV